MKRAPRYLFGVATLVALQVSLFLVYQRVTDGRREATDVSYETVSGFRPPLSATLLTVEGTRKSLTALTGSAPSLVHFWATWCVPCQKELPTLLDLANDPRRPEELEIVLVSVDDDWRPVHEFLGARGSDQVVLQGGDLARAFGVTVLPDTYLLNADGAVVARFRGARDWTSPSLVAELRRIIER